MALSNRIRMLERRAAGHGAMQILIISGGLPASYLRMASAGAHRWTQAPDETWPAFQERAITSAKKAGERSVTIGGLPREDDEIAEDEEFDGTPA